MGLAGTNTVSARRTERVDWVDAAKGICIILVVMMHTTLGLEKASGDTGWMHAVVAFSQPFRIPDFFLISGLFLAATIDRPWRLYLDRKVVHFFYFYILWVIIQFAFKGGFDVLGGEPVGNVLRNLAFAFVQPFGTLWFIYLLPVFFVVTKLLRHHPWLLLAGAAFLEIIPTDTQDIAQWLGGLFGAQSVDHGWVLVDEFCARFVYFVAGYLLADTIFRIAAWARENRALASSGLVFWACFNAAFVLLGISGWPLISLMLGAAGAMAIVVLSALISRSPLAQPLLHTGANSIVVYLAFFLPMIVLRILMLKFTPWLDPGTMALIGTIAGVASPLVFYAIVRRTGLGMFLFHRPNWAILPGTPWKRQRGPKASLQAAE